MKIKILLVAYYYPPYNNVASRRWAEMIPELMKENDIYVFTNNSTGDLKNPLEEDNVKRVSFIENLKFMAKNYRRSFIHAVISFFTKEIRTIDSTILSWFLHNRAEFTTYFEKIKPNILITTIGPFSSVLFGKYIKKRYPDVFWVVDIRDSFGLFNTYRKNFIQNFIDQSFDKWGVKNCDMLLTVSDSLSFILEKYYKKKVEIIYNGFPLNSLEMPQPVKISRKRNLYYAGKIYPHQEPSLYLLLNVVKNLDVNLKVRLVDSAERHDFFKNFLTEKSINNVQILTPAPADVIKEEEKNADILIVLEDLSTENDISKGTLTAKIFEYLQFNGSILAVCRKDSDISKILLKTNRGKVASSEKELADFITSEENYALNDIAKIKEFSRENQARKFSALIKKKFSNE